MTLAHGKTAAPTRLAALTGPGPVRDWTIRVAAFCALLLAWQLAAQNVSVAVLPTPRRVWEGMAGLLERGDLQLAWGQTAVQVAAGMLLSAVFGVVLGVLIGWFKPVDDAISPLLNAVFLMPRIALVPLIALWFGLQDTAKIALILSFSFFEIFFTVRNGVKTIENEFVEVAKAYCIPQWTVLRKVVLPAITPYVMTGLRLGLVYALVGVVLGGFFLESNGIGGLIYALGSDFRTAELIAALFTVMLVGLAVNLGLHRLENLLAPWKVTR
ncbi:ABC transporter permease [Sinosporangium siamense]|uniref:ABC transporter permease n=1 Tax=Sinosporangium siamense TaxID=1367973 RepID=A0A919RDM6_9ACTN|nr:ABC transporter permease [Sinosporangium siamense]GII90509.1 ABC transporter permease [Sinosporangium siamense]